MKKILCSIAAILSCVFLHAQITINVTNINGYLNYGPGQIFPDTTDFKFDNRLNNYDTILLHRGLHFRNRLFNTMNHSITDVNISDNNSNDSPVIGIHGNGTVLRFNGIFDCDGGNTKPSMVIQDTGKLIIGSNATIDVINTAYFARQIWTWGDGTGTVEFEEGFIADLTSFATIPKGLGSCRFSNCTVITNHSQNIPLGYRPYQPTSSYDVNAHWVFENEAGSVWEVNTNNQNYIGGLWIDANMTVETNKTLTLSGVRAETNYIEGGYYINWGGIMIRRINGLPNQLTKTGADTLIITGDCGFDTGSVICVNEGMLAFDVDPFTDSTNKGYRIDYKNINVSSPNLILCSGSGGTILFRTPLARIDSLRLVTGSVLQTGIQQKITARSASLGGTLSVEVPASQTLQQGDTFDLFDITSVYGIFDSINIVNRGNSIVWNTAHLYSQGKIFIESVNRRSDANGTGVINISISPNPFTNYFTIQIPRKNRNDDYRLSLHALSGQEILTLPLNQSETIIQAAMFKPGPYLLIIKNQNKINYHSIIVKK